MDSGNCDLKTLVIEAGGNNNRVKEKTLALSEDILTQVVKQQKTILDEEAFGG